MTSARQERKRNGLMSAAFLALFAALAAGVVAAQAATTEQIVVDWHSGLAIDGYDPVAFYTEGKPVPGSPDFELNFGGAIWRFRNVGNREAFAANPEVYMPKFGGYDPVGIGKGIAVAGNPTIWMISGGHLFLFYDNSRLELFARDPERFATAAEREWPHVRNSLSP
jgi:hypothetical protein